MALNSDSWLAGSDAVIYAKHVVLATGGEQSLPRLRSAAHQRKLLSSDFICTRAGLQELRKRLRRAGLGCRSGVGGQKGLTERDLASSRLPPGSVVIVGGSHSAFSAAWLCLNRLNDPSFSRSAASTAPTTSSDQQDTPPLSSLTA